MKMTHWTETPETPQKKGRRREKNSAQKVGGRLIPASGAILGAGGDFEMRETLPAKAEFLVEHKYTANKSFRLTRDLLDKIAGEAFRANRRPAMMIEFEGGETYVVFRLCDLDWERG